MLYEVITDPTNGAKIMHFEIDPFRNVITSYSIHYTKLYDHCLGAALP